MELPKRYVKRPIVIEAIQWTGDNLEAVWKFGGKFTGFLEEKIMIFTLEGTMIANRGDWIIKGVNGEFYPCKPDIFQKSYEESQ